MEGSGRLSLERKLFSDTTATPVVSLGLPKGWVREELVRQSGLSAGKVDVCYASPDGKKFWTKPQLSRYFGDTVDLSNFDFQTGKFHNNPRRNSGRNKRSKISSSDYW
jgi:methyl-CpG-binding domain protein 2